MGREAEGVFGSAFDAREGEGVTAIVEVGAGPGGWGDGSGYAMVW